MTPLFAVFALLAYQLGAPVTGRVVEARSGAPIAGAEIAVVNERGSVRSDAAGRFRWPIAPLPPFDVIVILRDGRVARPLRITTLDATQELTLVVDAAVSQFVSVVSAAPTVDASPAASTTLLTASDVALRHVQTLTQALDVVPGVSAISEGQAAVPAIRGLARGRTLILVDGGRASTERRAGANASFLDPAIVHAIEVSRGPGSVAYGSDAFGGVIAAHTRGPDYAPALRVRFAGTAGWGAPERSGDLEISRGYGAGGVLVAVRARDYDDYNAPAGLVLNSAWRDRGIRMRWEHLTGEGRWSIGWQSDYGRSLGRPRSDSDVVRTTSPFEDSTRVTASYQRGSLGAVRNLRFDALIGNARQRTDQDRLPTSMRARSIERADLESRELQLRVTAERGVGRARVHVGSELQGRYGLHAVDTTITHDLTGTVTSETAIVSIDSAYRTDVGIFAEASAPVARRVRLSGGARVNLVRNTNVGGFYGDVSVANAALAGLIAATVTPIERMTLTAQVARGFRDPTLSDRFYRGPVGRGFVQGNPDLKPETSLQFDLAARYTLGPIRLVAAAYDYRMADFVERYSATPTLFLFRNRGRADLRGGELEAHATLPRGFAATATMEASRGRDPRDGAALDDIAPTAVSMMVRHNVGTAVASYLRIKAVGSHSAAGPSEVPTASYQLVDAGVSWRATPRWELRASFRNLTNELYQSSAGPRSVWAPGRQGALTIVLAF